MWLSPFFSDFGTVGEKKTLRVGRVGGAVTSRPLTSSEEEEEDDDDDDEEEEEEEEKEEERTSFQSHGFIPETTVRRSARTR